MDSRLVGLHRKDVCLHAGEPYPVSRNSPPLRGLVLARPSDVKASDTKNKDGVNIDAEEQAWARQAESHTEPPERTEAWG